MKRVTKGFFAVGLATWVAFFGGTGLAQSIPAPKPFQVFDGLSYANKPDLSVYGFRPITVVYGQQFGPDWFKQIDRLPDFTQVQTVAREASQKGYDVVLDIEHWPVKGSPEVVGGSLTKYMTVLNWFRAAAPGLSVGYYGLTPMRDYWRAINGTSSPEYRAWMADNDRLHPLAGAVDAFFPSVYTFYPDQAGWKKYAIAQIAEARRNAGGKPVYVFLWPQYHDSNLLLKYEYLPADYWLLQLQTAREHADGIVIWGGYGFGTNIHPEKWNENAAWWNTTKEFMKTIDQARPSSPRTLTIQ